MLVEPNRPQVGTLTSLQFGSELDDDILKTLVNSSLVQTLLELNAGANCVTDDSAHCWRRFISLKTAALGGPHHTMVSYHEITRCIPKLEALQLSLKGELLSEDVLFQFSAATHL